MADFPRIRWLNIDGQQVPFTEPQHFTGNGDETVRTGHDNPLPVANYTKKGNIWLPVSEENPVPTQVTGSNVEYVFNNTVQSEQTNNLFIGETIVSGNHAKGFDISEYREIAFYIRNNTERPVKISSVRFGGVESAGNDEFYRTNFGEAEIAPGARVFISKVNEGLSAYSNYFDIKAPYFVIHLLRVGSEPMSDGNFDIRVIGIK